MATATTARPDAARPAAPPHCNEITLVGRLAAPATERALPSGDLIADFRVIVDRPRRRGAEQRAWVDTVDCVAWTARLRRQVSTWHAGEVVEVAGALRRRFWRTPSGPASRYEVEVERVRRATMRR